MAEDAAAVPAPTEATPAAPVVAAPVQVFVGVDLGVLNVVVASSLADEPTSTAIAVNEISGRATPATVGFDGKLRMVGDSAEAKISQLPKQTLSHLPAVLGTTDVARKEWQHLNCLWDFTDNGQIGPISSLQDRTLRPASALAPLLHKAVSFGTQDRVVTADGKPNLNPTTEIAVSVPDTWGEAELANLRAAIDILEWDAQRVRVIPFSHAIATAYAQRIGQKLGADETHRYVAFADVGFSHGMVSIAKFSAPAEGAEQQDLVVEACACASSPTTGTQSMCKALAEHLLKDFKEPVDLRSKRGQRLMTALHKSLKELSMLPDSKLAIECFFTDESDIVKDLTRSMLEEVARPQLSELDELAKKALADAGVAGVDVHSIELIGGGKSIPRVQQMLSDLFPEAEPDADVAPGALSKRLRFGLDAASGMAIGTTLSAAGKRPIADKWDLSAQKSALSEDELKECVKLEAEISSTSDKEVARLEKGNSLESFIYEVKSWLSGPDRALLKPELLEPIVDKEQMWFEDAMYDEATTIEMYTEHFDSLKQQAEEHGAEFFAKKQTEKEARDKMMDEVAEKERQRRKDTGMDDDKDDRKMAKSERLKMAGKNKEEGNTVFKAGNLEDAAGRYMRALQHLKKFAMLDLSDEDKAEGDAIGLSVQLNLAQVYLKLAAQTEKDSGKEKAEAVYLKAKASTEEALKIDENNVKAKFRKATAMEKLGDLDGSTKEVKAALKVDPENTDLMKMKERLDKLHAIQKEKQKKVFGKMFG